ncbi:threonine aldolase family protein [Robertkochia solimangrovi]|uniref:threonine aldolase family protein n=1 Tax=Robertkochia solimangrovi TaxID=2213046 RepID=UPI00117D8D24|nr:GntG family PLP-dependent aldolase [Robertkochia solimangrovi]TRZ45363.1 threonine aldolase [Robertkochia solimangrovi]
MTINLISDTVTKPDEGMLQAMMQAEVGDDVFKGDPTMNALEERVAKMFGKEAALFFPSGTMANQTAIKIHTQPGEQLIADKYAHIFNYEGGGVSFNSGVSCRLLDGDRGMITATQVEAAINPPDFYHSPLTTLVCLENTTNKGGGACYDFEEIIKIREVCDRHGLGFHLDGARLWNAMVKTGYSPEQYGKVFDTISVCFSKGLGCPVGSMLVGSKEMMDKALRIRKIFGGGMRQVGYLAAAVHYALDHNRQRLAEDHRRAAEIAEVLKDCDFVKSIAPFETNILIFSVKDHIDEALFMSSLKEADIHISSLGKGSLRIVTHKDYTEEMHRLLLQKLKQVAI